MEPFAHLHLFSVGVMAMRSNPRILKYIYGIFTFAAYPLARQKMSKSKKNSLIRDVFTIQKHVRKLFQLPVYFHDVEEKGDGNARFRKGSFILQ